MNKLLKIKIFFSSFLILVYSFLFLSLLILFFEIFDLGSKLLKKNQKHELHHTNYYGKKINFNPYKKFDKKFLHPYLTFSMASRNKDIEKVNNEFVNLNKKGFRINPFNKFEKNKTGILLGGSAAFGYYASSDKTTLAALISKKKKYNIYNLNGPSWNSHQELVSLLKFKKNYQISISFSGNNDFSIFCSKTIDTEFEKNYVDAVESYKDINRVFLSLTDSKIYHMDLLTVTKYFIVSNFPETLKVINYLKIKNKKNLPTQSTRSRSKCLNNDNSLRYENINKSINQFLENQKLMKTISNSRGAEHFLIIQPLYILQPPNGISLSEDYYNKSRIFNYVFSKIIQNDFCKDSCLDFSRIFNNRSLEASSYMDNFTGIYKNEIFIDNIHLSDNGNEIVADEITKKINF